MIAEVSVKEEFQAKIGRGTTMLKIGITFLFSRQFRSLRRPRRSINRKSYDQKNTRSSRDNLYVGRDTCHTSNRVF